MRHDDEFNSASYLPPKGDTFEFGSVFASNEHGVRKDNSSHKTDLNSTDTNNDDVSRQRNIGHKEGGTLENRLSNGNNANGSSTPSTSASSASGSSAVARAAATSVTAVEAASIVAATTIVAIGTAAGLRTLVQPDASFNEVFATAHTVRYEANIGNSDDGEFAIHLYGGTFDESQKAMPGQNNEGVFENLELGRTYTIEIVQSADDAESAILSSAQITTANYNKFNAFNFDGVADFDEGYFTIALDYIDEGDVFSDFTFSMYDVYGSGITRTYHLEKTTEEQKLYFNDPSDPSYDGPVDVRSVPFNYTMDYVSKESGEKRSINYKNGQLLFRDKYTPTFVSFEHSDVVSENGQWPVHVALNDPKDYIQFVGLECYREGSDARVTVSVDYFKGGWSAIGMSDADPDFDFYAGEFTVKVIGYVNNDMFYLPEGDIDYDYYSLPYKEFDANEGTVVLAEQKVSLQKGALSQLVGLRIYADDITEKRINAYPVIIDEQELYSDFRLVIECNNVTHKYELSRQDEVVSLEHDLATSMTFDEVYADLISHSSSVYIEATERGKDIKAKSSPQKVDFSRSHEPALDSYDFYDFITDGDNIFASFDVYDPDGQVADLRVDVIPLDGDENAQTLSFGIYNPTLKRKQMLPISNFTFSLTQVHTRIEIYMNVRNYVGDDPYAYKLVETIDNVLFIDGPSIYRLYFAPYAPVIDPNLSGTIMVKDPVYRASHSSCLTNLEVEIFDNDGHSAKGKCESGGDMEGMIAYRFAVDVQSAGIDVANSALHYRVYADSTFNGHNDKGAIQAEEDVGNISLSLYEDAYISSSPRYSVDGDEATLNIYLHGYNTANYFDHFKFVSSDPEATPYECEAEFSSLIQIPISSISSSPSAGQTVTLTIIATTRLEGNPEYPLGTIAVTIN